MVGTNLPLLCRGFIETETFSKAKERLKQLLELTDRDVDDRLEALIWALQRDEQGLVARRVGTRHLWAAVTDYPQLRLYLRPRAEVADECELLWIEETT